MQSDPAQIHATATRVSTLAEEFADDIETLRRESESLMAAAWVGDAAGTHSTLWSEWIDSARLIVAALGNDATLLHRAADKYSTSDTAHGDALANTGLDIPTLDLP
jgi:WXG100 family type VII secretion target